MNASGFNLLQLGLAMLTVLALGLNYADHAKELAFKPPEEPLAFAKGAASLIGHRARTVRPARSVQPSRLDA